MRPTRVVPAIVLCLTCLGLTVSLLPAYSQGRYAAFLPLLQREYRRPRLLSFVDSSGDLSVIASDGTGLAMLVPGRVRDPSWSPDGEQIAFSLSSPAGTDDLHIVNRDGSGLTRLGNTEGRSADAPQWSPDGTHVLYTSNR